jgi:aryl-alcohol dehydrogenase-like predicted oxidoreductase
MRKVELVKGIESSVLGFGCAPILGAISDGISKQALEKAIDCGINHLDLARSYGYGEAENFVGNIIQGKRNKLVIASKFGIKANWKAKLLGPFKPLVRKIRKSDSQKSHQRYALSTPPSTVANHFLTRITLNRKEMVGSLESTLRALKTDYLDYFLIHEPLDTILNIDELFETADQLKKDGKIRAFGLTFMQDEKKRHEEYLNRFDLLQFNSPPGLIPYYEAIRTRGNESNVIFSPMRGGDVDLQPEEKLRKLLTDFPNSVILCSMFSQKHVIANSKLAN